MPGQVDETLIEDQNVSTDELELQAQQLVQQANQVMGGMPQDDQNQQVDAAVAAPPSDDAKVQIAGLLGKLKDLTGEQSQQE